MDGHLKKGISKMIVSLNDPRILLDALPTLSSSTPYNANEFFYNFNFENLKQNQVILLNLLKKADAPLLK